MIYYDFILLFSHFFDITTDNVFTYVQDIRHNQNVNGRLKVYWYPSNLQQ